MVDAMDPFESCQARGDRASTMLQVMQESVIVVPSVETKTIRHATSVGKTMDSVAHMAHAAAMTTRAGVLMSAVSSA